jgi:uncharacterized membrane protein
MRLPLLILHISAGVLAMLAGALAISFRKGSRGHRMAGNVFVICMLSVSGLGAYLAFRKSEADNVLGGIFTFYLVATAWATARRGEAESWKLEWTTPPVALAVAAAWFFWGVEVTCGRMAVEGQSSAGGYFFFGVLALLCAAGDVRMLLQGHLSGAQRLVRHLWRMCFGWFIATISFFLGQPQVFPTWLRRSHVLVGLAFLPLLFLIFWFIRVRFTKTYQKGWWGHGSDPSLSSRQAENPMVGGTAGSS